MREIKFRGISTDNNQWLYGNLITDALGSCEIWNYESSIIGLYSYHKVLQESIGQYSGLKDSEGLEVFEGDILENPKREIGKVIWFNCGFSLECKRKNGQLFHIPIDIGFLLNKKIIGNIHLNPQLL